MIEGGVVYYVRSDHIGKPVFATDATGTKVWEATYLPFGGVHTSSGTNITLRFPGQWFQSESSLHQNWMRDYDPTTGRYIQADPLGLVDGASVYGYARQNTNRYIDPRGEDGCYTDSKTGKLVCHKSSDTYCPSGECGFRGEGWNNPFYTACKLACKAPEKTREECVAIASGTPGKRFKLVLYKMCISGANAQHCNEICLQCGRNNTEYKE